jgi:hypothetical protein
MLLVPLTTVGLIAVEPPGHTPPAGIETEGNWLEMPLNTIPEPVLLTAEVVKVLEPNTPYFVHGNVPEYFAEAILPSVPEISVGK